MKYIVHPLELVITQKISVLDAIKGSPFVGYDREILYFIHNSYLLKKIQGEIHLEDEEIINYLLDQIPFEEIDETKDEEKKELAKFHFESFVKRNDGYIWVNDEGTEE